MGAFGPGCCCAGCPTGSADKSWINTFDDSSELTKWFGSGTASEPWTVSGGELYMRCDYVSGPGGFGGAVSAYRLFSWDKASSISIGDKVEFELVLGKALLVYTLPSLNEEIEDFNEFRLGFNFAPVAFPLIDLPRYAMYRNKATMADTGFPYYTVYTTTFTTGDTLRFGVEVTGKEDTLIAGYPTTTRILCKIYGYKNNVAIFNVAGKKFYPPDASDQVAKRYCTLQATISTGIDVRLRSKSVSGTTYVPKAYQRIRSAEIRHL